MRERLSAVSSSSLRMIKRLASLKGARRPRQVKLVNEFYNFNDVRRSLHTLERFDELRQRTDCSIPGNTVFTANLALHFAFAERLRKGGRTSAREHPAEDRFVFTARRLRVCEAKQVTVRPAIALLILHRLVRQFISFTTDVPATHGNAQATTPTTQSIHILREVEQVRPDTADLAEVLEGQ